MEHIKIATAQFEHASGDKARNLEAIRRLMARAALAGAQAVAFHECSVTGILLRGGFEGRAAGCGGAIPDGPSIRVLTGYRGNRRVSWCLRDFSNEMTKPINIYKAYVAVDGRGLVAKFRKLHPFINPYILPRVTGMWCSICMAGNAGS